METIFSNRKAFLIKGWLSLVLLCFLAVALIALFLGNPLFSRELFVMLILLHVGQAVFLPVHYVAVRRNCGRKIVEIDYARRFTLFWRKRIIRAVLQEHEFGGIETHGRSWVRLTLFRTGPDGVFSLGPFSLGPVSRRALSLLHADLKDPDDGFSGKKS
jgi:hypothetical protein